MITEKSRKEYLRKWKLEHAEQILAYNKKYIEKRHAHSRELRLSVLEHYSTSPPECACCGETKVHFLTIDHINGGGHKHLRTIGGNLYIWLRKNNYPLGFRVLCMNCNFAIGHYGFCPHQVSATLSFL